MKTILNLYAAFLKTANCSSSLVLLAIRLWIAKIFWTSGYLKITSWESTIWLFTEEHPVPFLPPLFAAISGTTFELACSVMLVLGLGARVATLPLLAMTAVIQFTYQNDIEHFYWAFLLAAILTMGPGKLSVDYLIKKRFGGTLESK